MQRSDLEREIHQGMHRRRAKSERGGEVETPGLPVQNPAAVPESRRREGEPAEEEHGPARGTRPAPLDHRLQIVLVGVTPDPLNALARRIAVMRKSRFKGSRTEPHPA